MLTHTYKTPKVWHERKEGATECGGSARNMQGAAPSVDKRDGVRGIREGKKGKELEKGRGWGWDRERERSETGDGGVK